MPNDPIKSEILNIMSGRSQFVPQQKVPKTQALNEDILNLINSRKQQPKKSNISSVNKNLLGELNNIFKPKQQNQNVFGGDFSENINKILEESKKIPEFVEFNPEPVNENLLGRLDNIFKTKDLKKEDEIIIPLTEQDGSYLKIEKPLTLKDGKLSVDAKIITENLEKKTEEIHQTVSKLSSTVGGGAVGVIHDDGVNQEYLLKSVSNLIFKGPGVELTRKGKDVEVYIASSIDVTTDFPRESTMLELYAIIQQLNEDILSLSTSSTTSISGGSWGPTN
jgi:hypothetical protein